VSAYREVGASAVEISLMTGQLKPGLGLTSCDLYPTLSTYRRGTVIFVRLGGGRRAPDVAIKPARLVLAGFVFLARHALCTWGGHVTISASC
jgi:hypothetical protein